MLRIIWKAGCLETCTSGLGLGSGCESPAYTTGHRRLRLLHERGWSDQGLASDHPRPTAPGYSRQRGNCVSTSLLYYFIFIHPEYDEDEYPDKVSPIDNSRLLAADESKSELSSRFRRIRKPDLVLVAVSSLRYTSLPNSVRGLRGLFQNSASRAIFSE